MSFKAHPRKFQRSTSRGEREQIEEKRGALQIREKRVEDRRVRVMQIGERESVELNGDDRVKGGGGDDLCHCVNADCSRRRWSHHRAVSDRRTSDDLARFAAFTTILYPIPYSHVTILKRKILDSLKWKTTNLAINFLLENISNLLLPLCGYIGCNWSIFNLQNLPMNPTYLIAMLFW